MTYTKGQKTQLSKNFVSTEFDCHGKGCCTTTEINPKLIEYTQAIRDHFGQLVHISSGYRCPIHNKNVGGATGSRHAKGDAADIVVDNVAPAEVAKYAETIGILGIGLYETAADGFFVHVDTRDYKSFWYGQKQEYRDTFGGNPPMQKGAYGDDVKELQEKLIELGYDLAPYGADGDFGAKTEAAVKKFQSEHGLTSNGIVDETTESAIDAAIEEARKPKGPHMGDHGEEVKHIQKQLIELGYDLSPWNDDGDFGAKTDAAVRDFQAKYNLEPNGVVDEATQAALDAAVEEAREAARFPYQVIITANVLNVRSGPSTICRINTTVRKNQIYTIVEEKNGWGKLKSGAGWIMLQYTKKR